MRELGENVRVGKEREGMRRMSLRVGKRMRECGEKEKREGKRMTGW